MRHARPPSPRVPCSPRSTLPEILFRHLAAKGVSQKWCPPQVRLIDPRTGRLLREHLRRRIPGGSEFQSFESSAVRPNLAFRNLRHKELLGRDPRDVVGDPDRADEIGTVSLFRERSEVDPADQCVPAGDLSARRRALPEQRRCRIHGWGGQLASVKNVLGVGSDHDLDALPDHEGPLQAAIHEVGPVAAQIRR